MQGKLGPDEEIRSMLALARRMAGKYGQIGHITPDDLAQDAIIKLLNRSGDRPATVGWLYKTVRSAAFDVGKKYENQAKHSLCLDDRGDTRSVCELADENACVYLNGRRRLPDDDLGFMT